MYGEGAGENASSHIQKPPFVSFCLLEHSHFYSPEWGYLFQADIQSNNELVLVMMERN